MVKYCAVALCRNGSKKRPDLSCFCFPTRPNERNFGSGKFSVSEQIKNSGHSAIQESVHCILRVRKAISRFHFLVEN